MPRIIVLFVLVLGGIVLPGAAVDVTGFVQITSPGTYFLQNDILTSTKLICINISSSDVIFDGNSFTIDGVDAAGTYGIYVHNNNAALQNVSVRNVRMQDWQHGIFFYNVQNGSVENCTLFSNTQYGLYISMGGNLTVQHSTAMSNGLRGIAMDFTRNTTLEDITATGQPFGIRMSFSYNNSLRRNFLTSNTYGVYCSQSSGNTITNNSFNNTYNTGFGDTASSNVWNLSGLAGSSITGGPYAGGNAWIYPNGSGFSEITDDRDHDGFCDLSYSMNSGNTDLLPLASVTGQHSPVFAGTDALQMLLPGDGASPSHPTALYYLYDGNLPDGRAGTPDTLRFRVVMEEGGLSVTANVSEVDGTLPPLAPYLVTGNQYYFSHTLGSATQGNISTLMRDVPVSAQIGKFINASGAAGNPDPLIAVVNANFSRSSPGISGTDWRTVHDFTDARGLVFTNSTGAVGSINFSGGVDLCDADFAALLEGPITALSIREENVTLDTAVPGMAALNTSSRITMSCPGCTAGPAVLTGNTVAWYANGSAPQGSPVSALSWDNGTREVVFDAAHWTTYRVHGTGPDILISAPPDGVVTESASILLEGTADDPFGVARIELMVNGGPRLTASGTTLWNSTVLLDSGVNTITVRGTDSLECSAETQIHITRTVPPVQRAGGAGGIPAVIPVPTTPEPYPANLPARTVTISSADNRIIAIIILAENEQANSSFAITEEDPSLIDLESSFTNATVLCAFALEPAGTMCESPAQIAIDTDDRLDSALVQVIAQNSEGGWDTLMSTLNGTEITFTTDRFTRYAFIQLLPDDLPAGTAIPTPTPPVSGESLEEPVQQKSGNYFTGFLFAIAAITGAIWIRGRD